MLHGSPVIKSETWLSLLVSSLIPFVLSPKSASKLLDLFFFPEFTKKL